MVSSDYQTWQRWSVDTHAFGTDIVWHTHTHAHGNVWHTVAQTVLWRNWHSHLKRIWKDLVYHSWMYNCSVNSKGNHNDGQRDQQLSNTVVHVWLYTAGWLQQHSMYLLPELSLSVHCKLFHYGALANINRQHTVTTVTYYKAIIT